jgi:hypothetical protein
MGHKCNHMATAVTNVNSLAMPPLAAYGNLRYRR